MRDEQRFVLNTQHVKLLRAANVGWHAEWGAPCIDGKRPFGNGDLYRDMAQLLGVALVCQSCDEPAVMSGQQMDALKALYRELETALQVVLATGSFDPGEYVAGAYGSNWRRAR